MISINFTVFSLVVHSAVWYVTHCLVTLTPQIRFQATQTTAFWLKCWTTPSWNTDENWEKILDFTKRLPSNNLTSDKIHSIFFFASFLLDHQRNRSFIFGLSDKNNAILLRFYDFTSLLHQSEGKYHSIRLMNVIFYLFLNF